MVWIVRKHKYQELWWLFNTKTNTWLHQDFWSEAEANTKCKALNEKEKRKMYNTLEEKKIVFDEMGRAISKALPNIRSIELDIFKTEDEKTYEYIVVTFRGGSISVRNANINSMSANLDEISKLVNGGYYNEVETYKNLKGERKNEIRTIRNY